MMYFLDFDRTCFDTDNGFYPYLRERFANEATNNLSNYALAELLQDRITAGTFTFSPGELSQFLYEDAARFLRDKENGVMIITYGLPALQRAKVESAIYGIPRISTIYTGDVRKGDFIAPHIGMYGNAPVFVDDAIVELEILSSACPNAVVHEMRRDGGEGDGRWPVLHSLSELL